MTSTICSPTSRWPAPLPPTRPDPALIAFTSGTTSAPKGVIHSHQTPGLRDPPAAGQTTRPTGGSQLTATPVGHFIGMLGAFLIPVLDGASIDLFDVWDPGEVLALMERDGLTIGGGPPYFVTSLLDHPDLHPRASGPDQDRRARRVDGPGGGDPTAGRSGHLSCSGPTAAASTRRSPVRALDAPEDKRLLTDGCPMPGVEIRLGAGRRDLQPRPDLCLGYTDDALTAAAFDDDGWYRTGDVGVLDDDGYLTITDRKADVIIRGGENISARGGRRGAARDAGSRRGGGGRGARRRSRRAGRRRAAAQDRAT